VIRPMMQPEAHVNILHTHGLTQLRPCTKTVTEKTTCHHSPFKQLRRLEDGKYKRGTCTDSSIKQAFNHTADRQVWPNPISVTTDMFIHAVPGHSNIELVGSFSGQLLSNVSAFTYGKS